MQVKRLIFVLVLFIGSFLAWKTSLAAQNDENKPTAVGLLDFTAAVQSDGVRLDWETATELNTAGFYVQRNSNGSSFTTLDGIGFVVSTGGVATGAEYSEVDTTAVIGQTYTYKLVEVEIDSSQHDLETVTIFFNPQPTATSIIISGPNPTSTRSSTPSAATATSTAAATATAVSSPNTGQPTVTPQATTTRPPSATPDSSVPPPAESRPANTLQASPTASTELDQIFAGSGSGSTGSGGLTPGVALAQEEPSPAAYPGPDTATSGTPADANAYPDEQEPPMESVPQNPTPYPAVTGSSAVPTLAIIGSSNPYPSESNTAAPAPSSEVIRGRVLLWGGFLLALLIFLSGVIGAIMLYRRRPA